MTGTILAQIITIIAAPILTRIYSPSDYGVLAFYSSIISILAVISCGRYEIAIVIPDNDEEAGSLFILSLLIGLLIVLIIFIIILFVNKWIPIWLPSKNISTWIWLVPINLVIMSLFQALSYWNIRVKEYNRLAKRKVNQSIATALMQILLSVFKLGERGLIVGALIGQSVATGLLMWQTSRTHIKDFRKKISRKKIYSVARKFRKFPLYDSWPSLLDNLTVAMPIIFFTYFYGSSVSGQLALTLNILAIPSALIGASVSQVYFQRLATSQNEGMNPSTVVEPTFIGLLGIGVCFCLLVLLLAPPLFPIVFGSSWVIAGQYARILAPAISLRFIVSPLSSVFAVLNRLELIAMWKVTSIVFTVGSLALSIKFNNPSTSLFFLMVNDLLIYSFYLTLIFKISNSSILHSVKYSYVKLFTRNRSY